MTSTHYDPVSSEEAAATWNAIHRDLAAAYRLACRIDQPGTHRELDYLRARSIRIALGRAAKRLDLPPLSDG